MDAIQKAMARAAARVGEDQFTAVEFAGRMVASSAAAATKEAKRYRKYRATSSARRGRPRVFAVKSDKAGSEFLVEAASVRELKADPRVQIRMRGAARHTWVACLHKIGGRGSTGSPTRSAVQGAQKAASVDINRSRVQPSIRLTNAIGYAEKALKGGRAGLDGIVGKAARRMHRMMNAQVARRMAQV